MLRVAFCCILMIRLGANSEITLVFADVQRGFEFQFKHTSVQAKQHV